MTSFRAKDRSRDQEEILDHGEVAGFINVDSDQAAGVATKGQSRPRYLFVQQNKLKPQVAELTLSRRHYEIQVPTQDYIADVTEQSRLLKQFGVLQKEPNWRTIVDTTIAQQALAGLK